jgi:hypothetical protein
MKKTKTITVIEDDLSGGEATETIKFGVNGDTYEIDLNEKNAAQFRKDLEKYIKGGRKLNGRPKKKGTRRIVADPPAREVREWAVAQGIPVPAHGRIPREVRDAFFAARGQKVVE